MAEEVANDNEEPLLEIESALESDADGSLKRRLQSEFDEHFNVVEAKLKAGVAPDDYADLNALKAGLESARIVLERAWLQHHGT